MVENKKKIPIALVSTNRAAYSETFIKAHAERLPATVHFLSEGWLPRRKPDGTHFVAESALGQGLAYHADRLRGRPPHATLRKKITAYLRENRIRAVLAEYGPSGVEMMDICTALGIPLVVHFHGFDAFDGAMLADWGPRYAEMFSKAAAIVGVSKHMLAQLEKLGAPPAKLHYNPCGADADLFHACDAGQNPPVFLATGRFSETKRPDLTIKAFAKALPEIPGAKLRLAGEGPLLEHCKTQVRDLKIERAVEFSGVLSHAEVSSAMQQVRAFVQHSHTTPSGDSEGTPVAILEAGLSGLPVISTRHAGIPDVVVEGKTGLLVDEGDVAGMASAMVRLGRDAALAGKLGEAAAAHVTVHFSLAGHIEKLWGIITDAVKNAGP